MARPRGTPRSWLTVGGLLIAVCGCSRRGAEQATNVSPEPRGAAGAADAGAKGSTSETRGLRGRIGSGSGKIKTEGGKTYIWAGGDPSGPGSHWYEFTDSAIPAGDLQFGIGKDRIPSIDDPLFVAPDDRRLLDLPQSPYREDERATTVDEIRVIGFVEGPDARAYPVGLLDHHELVNDRIGGKPVTVGW